MPLKIFYGTKGLMALELDMCLWVLELYQDCSKSDLWLALTFFYGKVKLKMLEYTISWKVLKIFAQECPNVDLGLNLTILMAMSK